MKSFYLLLSGLAFLFLLSCNKSKDNYDATGSFEATEIIVSSQANGKIVEFTVNEGEQLQQGQQVGLIDSTQLHLQKMSLLSNQRGVRAQQPDIRTQTAAIQEQIRTLEREKARVQRLLASNAANRKQLDDIESQIDVLQRQLSAQTSTLQKNTQNISAQGSTLDIQIAQLEDQLEKTRIVSPISGMVLNKYVEMGELAGMGTPLFKIADTNTLYLRAYVTNDQLAQIKISDEVTVSVDAGDGKMKPYTGTLNWISDKSEFTPKTIQTKNERANLVYAIKIAVPNDGYLKIGMYGEVVF
ncbi:HlyD family secretion protein [Petrimonas sp.]|uniref:HlyD family secretion protein n=1 Tax=Petrimonas sp. TaxID=2023866 RepID=UPI003F514574